MSPPLTCTACGHSWDQGPDPITGCARCGGTNLSAVIEETIGHVDDAVAFHSVEKVRTGRRKKRLIEGFARSSETLKGPLAGTNAWVEQTFDRSVPGGRYKKRVTLSDGKVSKDVEGPIDDQSLHGEQGETE